MRAASNLSRKERLACSPYTLHPSTISVAFSCGFFADAFGGFYRDQVAVQGGKGGFLLGGIHAAAGGCTVSIGGTLGIAGGGSIKVFILWLAMLVLADTDAIAAIPALFIGTHEITLLSVARATIKCLQEAEEPEQSRQHAQEAAEGAGEF